jgi:hypothetical protein
MKFNDPFMFAISIGTMSDTLSTFHLTMKFLTVNIYKQNYDYDNFCFIVVVVVMRRRRVIQGL